MLKASVFLNGNQIYILYYCDESSAMIYLLIIRRTTCIGIAQSMLEAYNIGEEFFFS